MQNSRVIPVRRFPSVPKNGSGIPGAVIFSVFIIQQVLQLSLLLFLLSYIVRINRIAENDKALKQKFGDEIDENINSENQILIPVARVGKICHKPGAEGSKYGIVRENEKHCLCDIRRALERVPSVYRKIPDYAEYKRDKIADPVVEMPDFIHQGKGAYLNKPRGHCDKRVFDCPEYFFFHNRAPFCQKNIIQMASALSGIFSFFFRSVILCSVLIHFNSDSRFFQDIFISSFR